MFKQLFLTGMASIAVVAASAQVKVNLDIDPNEPLISTQPVKLTNNGRVLSKKGMTLVFPKDIAGIRVSKETDTMFLTLKPEAFKLLDADAKANYEPVAKPRKGGKKADKATKEKVVKVTSVRKSDGKVVQ